MAQGRENSCFLCEKGELYLMTSRWCNVYCSIRPDLDPKCKKPLHLLIAPQKHFESFSKMDRMEYLTLMAASWDVQRFFLEKGYGPAVSEFRLEPGPHTNHPHVHLVFSSNPLRPFKEEKRALVDAGFLEVIKTDVQFF